jgi:hypothetical protein
MILYHLSSEKKSSIFNLNKKEEEKFGKRIDETLSK